MTVDLEDIEAAARILAGQVSRTPTVPAPTLSARFGTEIVLKLENLQITGSFKTRGALVKLAGLSNAERRLQAREGLGSGIVHDLGQALEAPLVVDDDLIRSQSPPRLLR